MTRTKVLNGLHFLVRKTQPPFRLLVINFNSWHMVRSYLISLLVPETTNLSHSYQLRLSLITWIWCYLNYRIYVCTVTNYIKMILSIKHTWLRRYVSVVYNYLGRGNGEKMVVYIIVNMGMACFHVIKVDGKNSFYSLFYSLTFGSSFLSRLVKWYECYII